MAIYSIGDLAKLSGVKAHTLRVWEQRYGILQPKRTDANVRYYDDNDMRHLLNVALLNRNGLRISQIAKLTDLELNRRVAELAAVSEEASTQLDALTLSMLEMDEERFDRILSVNIRQLGFEQAMMTVIFPFLEKLSILWLTGSVKPVQESFTSGLIRRKLLVAIEDLPHPGTQRAPKLLMFLPEGEVQEMSLVLLHYLARKRGYRVFYLGRDMSIQDVQDAFALIKPEYVFTMLTETFVNGRVKDYATNLKLACQGASILLSGYQAVTQMNENIDRIHVLPSMHDTLSFLDAAIAVSTGDQLKKVA